MTTTTTSTTTTSLSSRKSLQNSLRAVIVAGSVGGFLAGWVLLAHAGKPVSIGAVDQPAGQSSFNLQELRPSGIAPGALQALPSLQGNNISTMPRFRTRGS